jgi:hypothetical protein
MTFNARITMPRDQRMATRVTSRSLILGELWIPFVPAIRFCCGTTAGDWKPEQQACVAAFRSWLSFLPPTFGFSAPTELALSRLNCFTIHRLVLYRLPLHYQSLIGWQPLPPLNFMKYAFSRPHPRSDVV